MALRPSTIYIFLAIVAICAAVSAQADPPRSTDDFRYVFIENRVHVDENTSNEIRVLEVLLDERSFSEETLRVLFRRLSERFKDERALDVTVYTTLEQAPTPEERDAGGTSGQPPSKEPRKLYLWAIYVRHSKAEFFRYSPLHDRSSIETVNLCKPKQ